jgi:hypothetical protein
MKPVPELCAVGVAQHVALNIKAASALKSIADSVVAVFDCSMVKPGGRKNFTTKERYSRVVSEQFSSSNKTGPGLRKISTEYYFCKASGVNESIKSTRLAYTGCTSHINASSYRVLSLLSDAVCLPFTTSSGAVSSVSLADARFCIEFEVCSDHNHLAGGLFDQSKQRMDGATSKKVEAWIKAD